MHSILATEMPRSMLILTLNAMSLIQPMTIHLSVLLICYDHERLLLLQSQSDILLLKNQ